MSNLFEEIQNRQDVIEERIEALEKALRAAPSGRLRISMSRGKPRFYEVTQKADNCGKYIPKTQAGRIRRLAQADYDRKILRSIQEESDLISRLADFYTEIDEDGEEFFSSPEEKILKKMNPVRRELIDPFDDTEEGYIEKWMNVVYDKKGFDPEAPEYYTGNKIRVRSETELMIAEMLEKQTIPFHYEKPLELRGFGTVHPNFTVLNVPQRKTMYWEHLGMMDDESNRDHVLRKIEAYMRNGLFPGIDLILTHETSERPLRPTLLEDIIDVYLLD